VRAVVIYEHGGPEVLRYVEDYPDPVAGPGEVLVAVEAVALNHLDLFVRRGLPDVKVPLPHIPGCDMAGRVAALGPGVVGHEVGEEVIVQPGQSCMACEACLSGRDNLCRRYSIIGGYQRDGGCCELVNVPAVNLMPKPANVSWEVAAAFPLTFLTAGHMLSRAGIRPGMTVLVQSAASGVGSAAVQIAKFHGARVIATASTQAKLDLARSLGADETIEYRSENVLARVRELTGKRGVDIVFEHVGGKVIAELVRAARPGGVVVTCGASEDSTAAIDLRYLYIRDVSIIGSYMGEKAGLLAMLPLLAEGKLRPAVDSVLPLEKAAEAHQRLENRAAAGKVVLRVGSAA